MSVARSKGRAPATPADLSPHEDEAEIRDSIALDDPPTDRALPDFNPNLLDPDELEARFLAGARNPSRSWTTTKVGSPARSG